MPQTPHWPAEGQSENWQKYRKPRFFYFKKEEHARIWKKQQHTLRTKQHVKKKIVLPNRQLILTSIETWQRTNAIQSIMCNGSEMNVLYRKKTFLLLSIHIHLHDVATRLDDWEDSRSEFEAPCCCGGSLPVVKNDQRRRKQELWVESVK